MKKVYIEPVAETLRLETLQAFLVTSLVTVNPSEETESMDAKESYDSWFSSDEE